MEIIDTYQDILAYFPNGQFSLPVWRKYIKAVSPELLGLLEEDSACYNFQADILPVVKAALQNRDGLQQAHCSFLKCTGSLKQTVEKRFPAIANVTILLYLGLCNGAGWAAQLKCRPAVLLGLEKILELNWENERDMAALLYHELGHLWHFSLRPIPPQEGPKEKWAWQLYEEGVAMYFEQELSGDPLFFHQDRDGWLSWCLQHEERLKQEAVRRISRGESLQDFFGDWCSFEGHSDVGYFLGSRFLRSLLKSRSPQEAVCLSLPEILAELEKWAFPSP